MPKRSSSQAVGKLESGLAVLKEIVERIESTMTTEFAEMKGRQDKTNGNVRNLQLFRAWMIGFATCVSLILLPIGIAWAKSQLGI